MELPKPKVFVLFFIILFSFSLIPSVSAVGISPADAYVNFMPNQEYLIDYSVTGYRAFEFYTEGAFSEYTWVETLHHTETQGNFRVHLLLPDDYETPGKHRMYVAAREKPVSGTVNTIAVIRGFVEIDVPFPGYYATLEVSAGDVNEGEPVTITVNAYNKGRENITNARLRLTVSSGNMQVKTFDSEQFSMETTGGYTFQKTIAGGDLKPGSYTATADLFYEGKPKQKSADFRVGTFDVRIVNYTREMLNNSVNLFGIEIESLWNNPLSTVWMDLSIKNGTKTLSTIKTPPFDMVPWEKRKTEVYWNTAGIEIGEYDLEIVLHYGSGTRTENRKIYIVDKPQMVVEKPIPVSTIILVFIAVTLIIFNIFFILKRRKEDEDKKDHKDKGK